MAIENQHVLIEAGGRQAVDRGQTADRLGGECRDDHQRQGHDQERYQEEGAPPLGATLVLAEQPQAAVEGVAGQASARHQAGANACVPGNITKYDNGYVVIRVYLRPVRIRTQPQPRGRI